MVTFDQLVARARADIESSHTWHDEPISGQVDDAVRSTIAGLGLAIDTITGEVYNPAAQDRVQLTPVADDNSRRYSGRFRKRR